MDSNMVTSIDLLCWEQVLRACTSEVRVIKFITSLKHISGIPLEVLGNSQFDNKASTLCVIPGSPASLTFEAESRLLTLRIDWELIEERAATFTNLMGQLLSLACADNGEFPIHAAAVSKGRTAYLLIGGPGAGKTNLSLLLCKDFDFKWLSNDWCSLTINGSEIEVVHGHDLINFRREGFDQIAHCVAPEVASLIRKQFLLNNNTIFESKSAFLTSGDLGLTRERLPCALGGIFFIEVGRMATSHYCQRIPPICAIDLILQELFWPLRGLGSFVIDKFGKVVCPSLVLTPKMGWESLCRLANLAVLHYPCYIVKAPLRVAADFISVVTDEHNLTKNTS